MGGDDSEWTEEVGGSSVGTSLQKLGGCGKPLRCRGCVLLQHDLVLSLLRIVKRKKARKMAKENH